MRALALMIGTDGRQVAGTRWNDAKRRTPRHVARVSVVEIVDGR